MKKLFILIAIACSWIAAMAQLVASPALRHAIKQARVDDRIEAFVSADDAAIAAMRRAGMTVDTRIDGLAIVNGTRSAFNHAMQLDGVSNMDIPSRVHLHTDSSRSYTHVNALLQGQNMDMPYDGTGVVVGIVDCGIDYQHMAFKDANGKSRISRVYHPAEKGPGVIANGENMPGREYTTPEEIASLTTDDKTMGHGTHTSCIAAGTTVGRFGGMAPGAEIVMVGIPSDALTTTNVARGCAYIASYAASVGRRCVINMSLGENEGSHDSSAFFCRFIQKLTEKYGTIFVLSAGNEGNTPLYLHKEFGNGDNELSTVMMAYSLSDTYVEAWSRSSDAFGVSFSIYDSKTRRIIATSPVYTTSTDVNLSTIEGFTDIFSGTVSLTNGQGSNGRFMVSMKFNTRAEVYGNYLGFTIHGADGTVVDVWDIAQKCYFSDCGLSGYSSGTSEGSYNSMACNDYCISVGALSARASYPANNRSYNTGYAVGQMAKFSSYGTDLDGRVHPFVVAPGVSVVSAVSHYNCSTVSYSQRLADADGINNYWYVKSGTSMSAPCATGVIALWLQACPTATLDQIKEAIVETSKKYANGSAIRGENGDLDALAGVKYLLGHASALKGDVNGDGVVDIADINVIINIILNLDTAEKYGNRAYVNDDDAIDIADVNAIINIILNI